MFIFYHFIKVKKKSIANTYSSNLSFYIYLK